MRTPLSEYFENAKRAYQEITGTELDLELSKGFQRGTYVMEHTGGGYVVCPDGTAKEIRMFLEGYITAASGAGGYDIFSAANHLCDPSFFPLKKTDFKNELWKELEKKEKDNGRYIWICNICSSGADGIISSVFVGTAEEADKYLLSLIFEDMANDPDGYEYGSDKEKDLGWNPSDDPFVIDGYATFSTYHIEYRMNRLDKVPKVSPGILLTDEKIEEIWDGLSDIMFEEDEEGNLRIEKPYYIWNAGTDREEIWLWFDTFHSKGVRYLLYERKAD